MINPIFIICIVFTSQNIQINIHFIINNNREMLAKIMPKFVISRVIMTSHFAKAMAIQLLKQPLGITQENSLFFEDSKHYYETKFYGYISTLHKPQNFTSKYEQAEYDRACRKLQEFNEISDLTEGLGKFHEQVRILYSKVQSTNTSSNFLSRKSQTSDQFERDVVDAIQRFNTLEDNLSKYPEWKYKVVDEIGGLFHMIHNNMEQSESKRIIFLKLNRQEYFI